MCPQGPGLRHQVFRLPAPWRGALFRARPGEFRPPSAGLLEAGHEPARLPPGLVFGQHGFDDGRHVGREILDSRERRGARHHFPVARPGGRMQVRRLLAQALPVGDESFEDFGFQCRRRARIDAQGGKGIVLDVDRRLEALDEGLAVVGQQQEVVARPGELDVEEIAPGVAAGLENGDRRPCRCPLGDMDGRAIGVIEMTQLRIGSPERVLVALGIAEVDLPHGDLRDLRLSSVDEIGDPAARWRLAVAGPADAFAGLEFDPLGIAQAHVPGGVARGTEASLLAVGMQENHLALVVT